MQKFSSSRLEALCSDHASSSWNPERSLARVRRLQRRWRFSVRHVRLAARSEACPHSGSGCGLAAAPPGLPRGTGRVSGCPRAQAVPLIPWPPLPPGLGSGGTEGSPANREGPQRRLRGAKLNRGAPKVPSYPVICALGVGKSTKSYIITDFTKLRLRARICLSALSTLTEILIPSLLPCEVVMIVPIVQLS